MSKMRMTSSWQAKAKTMSSLPGFKAMLLMLLRFSIEFINLALQVDWKRNKTVSSVSVQKEGISLRRCYSHVAMSWMKTFPSFSPLKRRLLPELMAKQYVSDPCLVFITTGSSLPSAALRMGHKRTTLSWPPEANRVPSSENSIVAIEPLWPVKSWQWNFREEFQCWRWTRKQLAAKEPRALMGWTT